MYTVYTLTNSIMIVAINYRTVKAVKTTKTLHSISDGVYRACVLDSDVDN